MVSHWHSGSPAGSARLVWSSEDTIFEERQWELEGISTLTSIMDGLLLYWFPFLRPNKRTLIYMADLRKQAEEGQIIISKVAQLHYFAQCCRLLENKSGFVTAEWVNDEKALKLRRHTLDGTLVKEKTVPVAAAWGELRVFGQKVSICASSGLNNVSGWSQTPDYLRLSDGEDSDSQNLIADQIIEWDTDTDTLRRIAIPNSSPEQHGGEFYFLNEHLIALACVNDDPQGPLLTCFTEESEARSFSPGGTSDELVLIGTSIGLGGSSESSDILVHPSSSRIAVFDKNVLTTDIPDNPRTARLHFIWNLLLEYNIRLLPFALPGSLPAISGNRVLAYLKVNRKYVFYILDFDQERVGAFLDKTPQEREDLCSEMGEAGARVKIVTRRFFAHEPGIGGHCEDSEYPLRQVPPDWQTHLRELADKEKQDPPLLFDEAPSERGRPFGFVQSLLRLGKEISWIERGRMAMTDGAVVSAPEPACDGMVWYFD
ncbi:DEAH-box ATP-dependent RNA helicase prp22 [Stygiomarasmius scandens]|uniref:DEAH-box ATP-dependent RNA helicase prp22 n=1 Tax=Marasmiellus scandens TaxID=2682957 RepID=A0ABR1J8C0_9AGAR